MTDLSNENIHIEDNEENDQNIDIVNRQRRRPNKGQEKPTQEPKKRGRPSTNKPPQEKQPVGRPRIYKIWTISKPRDPN